MSVQTFYDLADHYGHALSVAIYGKQAENVAIECENCNEILLDFDREEEKMKDVTCVNCLNDFEGDDVLWATAEGKLEGDTRPYCVACAPEEPDYEGESE